MFSMRNKKKILIFLKTPSYLEQWIIFSVVLCLTFLSDSNLVYHRAVSQRKKKDMIGVRRNIQSIPPAPTASRVVIALLLSQLVGGPGNDSYSSPSPDSTTPLNQKIKHF